MLGFGGYLTYHSLPILYALATAPKLEAGASLLWASWRTGQSADDLVLMVVGMAVVGIGLMIGGFKFLREA